MPEKVKITKTKLDNLANAVAAKSGQPVLLTVDQMTDAILGINLGEENILEGVKVNNIELPIVDKKVNIPAATVSSSIPRKLATAGVVTQKLWDNINDNFDYFDSQVNNIYDQIESINNAGYITEETDPTVPAWAKQSTKPTYTAAEIGAVPFDADQAIATLEGNISTLRFVSTNTANRYVQAYVNTNNAFIALQSKYGNTYPIANVKLKGIASPQDSTDAANKNYVDNAVSGLISQETDPTVPSWAKASTKPSYNFSEIGSTPTTISGYGITDAYTKTQVDGLVAGVLHYKGTKAAFSNLPTSGNTTGDTWHITADGSEWAWDGTIWQELGTAVDLSDYVTTDDSRLSDARTPTAHNQALSTITGADDLKAIEGLTGTNGLLKKTAANTWTLDTSNYLTSYTETDPVFSASAAAGITSTDISNWNAKVSDTGKWNNVSLDKTVNYGGADVYVPYIGSTTGTSAALVGMRDTVSARTIAVRTADGHLYAATPSANDNSTKVATTAYVDNAIPDVSGYVNKSGDTMSGRLTLDYNSGNDGLRFTSISKTYVDISPQGFNGDTSNYTMRLRFQSGTSSNGVILEGIASPSNSTDAANKQYVDNAIPKVYSSTNTSGYLTMATLPIYDGTVV